MVRLPPPIRLRLDIGRVHVLDVLAFLRHAEDPPPATQQGGPPSEAPPTAEHHARAELGVPFGFQLGAPPIDAE